MKKSLLSIILFSCFSVVLFAQKGIETTPSGLKYKIFNKKSNPQKIVMGDVVTLGVIVRNSKDSIIDNTYNKPRPLRFQLQQIPFKGSMEEGLLLLAEGDSAILYVKADSLYNSIKGQKKPNYIASNSLVSFTVKVKKVQSLADFKKEKQSHYIAQKEADDKLIREYLTKNYLSAQKSNSGLYKITQKEGTGKTPDSTNLVQVNYVAKILNSEKPFEVSMENNPYGFKIGLNIWLKGLEEGLFQMKKGEKSTFILPSHLAYGEKGLHNTIAPNSVLVFDIELVNIGK